MMFCGDCKAYQRVTPGQGNCLKRVRVRRVERVQSVCECFECSYQLTQPDPQPGTRAIVPLVMADLEARRQKGIKTYGRELEAHNGRDALQDLYEELLDAACYIRQVMEERKVNR